MNDSRKVCVIGERTVEELFEEDENPIGEYISINNISFKVIEFISLFKGEVLVMMVTYIFHL